MPQGSNRKPQRNAEVMRLMGLGWSQARIGKELGISQVRVSMIQQQEIWQAEFEYYRSKRNVPR